MSRDGLGGQESGEPARSVTDVLRAEIVSGVFSPNERLVEADLSDLYRVSRGTARAALTELAKEGLVERQPNRGARVRALSAEEATELTEARFAMEGLCAGHAARHATSEEAAELRALLSAMGEPRGLSLHQVITNGSIVDHSAAGLWLALAGFVVAGLSGVPGPRRAQV